MAKLGAAKESTSERGAATQRARRSASAAASAFVSALPLRPNYARAALLTSSPPLLAPLAPSPLPITAQESIKDPAKLAEVKRVLFGLNAGEPVAALELPPAALAAAKAAAAMRPLDVRAFAFRAAPEQLRAPRVVRIGLVQNAIVAPTTAPYEEQRRVRGGADSGGSCCRCCSVRPYARACSASNPSQPCTAGRR